MASPSLEENYPVVPPNRSFNDWTQLEQQIAEQDEHEGYTKSETDALLAGKVDKEDGKGLSSNDFTDGFKQAIIENTEDIVGLQEGKVDKEDGKGLSSNDFTDGYKTQISDNTNRLNDHDTELQALEGNFILLEGRVETNEGNISTINTEITAIGNELTRLEADKQDKLIVGQGIDINTNTIKVKVDGTTIDVNSQGLLYAKGAGGGGGGVSAGAGISVSGNQVSVNVDGSTIRINDNNKLVAVGGSGMGYLDGGVANSTFLPTDFVDGGNA